MSCPEHELLSAYADGELESSMLAETERHLSGCAACREFVKEMGWLESYGRASLRTISVRAGPDPITIFNTAERPRRLSPVALAAAAIVLVALSVLTWSETRRLTHLGHVPPQVPAEIQRPVDGVDRAETAEIVKDYRIRASTDQAVERW